MGKITLTTEELDKIIKEAVKRVLKEGIDVDIDTKSVGFNPNHQNYIDTNDHWNPKPIYNNVRGYDVISIFTRQMSNDRLDGNPLIYALKGKEWKLKHPRYDIMALLRRFVAVTKELKETYDVIITIPSSNSLNKDILHKIERLIPHSEAFSDFFYKYTVDEVYDRLIDSEWLSRTYPHKEDNNRMHKMLYTQLKKMGLPKSEGGNDGIFSYKFIKPTELRNAINQSMGINEKYKDTFYYSNKINGKKVLIIDDTVTSGKTLSDSADAIMDTYDPKSITFLTLFSPLKK